MHNPTVGFKNNAHICIFQLKPRLKPSSELLSLFWREFLCSHPAADLVNHQVWAIWFYNRIPNSADVFSKRSNKQSDDHKGILFLGNWDHNFLKTTRPDNVFFPSPSFMAGTCSKKAPPLSWKWPFKIHHFMQLWQISSCAISFPSFLSLSSPSLNPALHFKSATRNKGKGAWRSWNLFIVTGPCFLCAWA